MVSKANIVEAASDMPGIHRYDFSVPEDVVDENGHVNNVVYLQWLQDAAVAH